MNLDEVRSKLEVLDGNRAQLERLRGLGAEAFQSDVLYLDSALHRLQTSIQLSEVMDKDPPPSPPAAGPPPG